MPPKPVFIIARTDPLQLDGTWLMYSIVESHEVGNDIDAISSKLAWVTVLKGL